MIASSSSHAAAPTARRIGDPLPGGGAFLVYWLGQALSAFGDAFAFVALPLLVLEATQSIAMMGLVSAAGVAARVVTSLFSGALVDRADRRRLMIACDLGQAAVYFVAPACWFLAGPSLPVPFAIAIVGGALGNTFSVAHMAAVPALVPRERLHAANARLQGSVALGYVLGSMLAGAACARFGPTCALLVDGATFLVAAATLLLIRFGRPVEALAPKSDPPRFGAGLRFLVRHPMLRAITLLSVALGLTGNVGMGAGITDLMIFHLKRELALGDQVVGLCMSTAAFGAILGAVAAPGVAKRIGSGRCLLVGTLVQAIGLLAIGAVSSALAAASGGLLWAAGMMLRGIPVQALRQAAVPDALMGRVTAVSWLAVFGASALGTAIVTRAAASAGADATLWRVGLLLALVAAVGALSPARDA